MDDSLVDCRPWRYRDYKDILEDTERIVRLLSEEVAVDPITFERGNGNVLRCKGYVECNEAVQRLELVFELPSGFDPNPKTLRSMLVDEAEHPLKQRYELCLKLAGTLFILHTTRFVHKRIRPDSIILMERAFSSMPQKYPNWLGEPFLLGWGDARLEDGPTKKIAISKKVQDRSYDLAYTHFRDVGEKRNNEYRTLDDIYSFGVVLIEIALWKSFFIWDSHERRYVNNNAVVDLAGEDIRKAVEGMYTSYRNLAQKEVRTKMGDKFSQVVLDCLSCFEEPFKFGKPLKSKKGTTVSQGFMELVVDRLRNVCDHI